MLEIQEAVNVIYYYYRSLLDDPNVSVEETLFLFFHGTYFFDN